jgi:hypothetical protein
VLAYRADKRDKLGTLKKTLRQPNGNLVPDSRIRTTTKLLNGGDKFRVYGTLGCIITVVVAPCAWQTRSRNGLVFVKKLFAMVLPTFTGQ